jgi:type IV secretion system protein VirB10
MNADSRGPDEVAGERGTNSVSRILSVQSRISNVLAIGLMCVLGLGSLAWYYANALTRQDRIKQQAAAASAGRAQGDMPLPSLGHVGPPGPPPVPEPFDPQGDSIDRNGLGARTLAEVPLAPSVVSTAVPPGAPTVKTPAQLALERQLSGVVYARSGTSAVPAGELPSGEMVGMAGMAGGGSPADHHESGDLAALLHPTATSAVHAQMLPAQRLLLPKGAFIDCTLETAIDSTLPGMTTCIMATDTFGVDGKVVLLERGTKLIGETRGQVSQGAARIFVLWTEARTPTGVIVPLDSPGADELGRSGLPGEVNRHFWQRFGAAMLVSVVDGAVQAAAQSSRSGGGNVVVSPSASQDVLTEILRNTINIAPTVVKRNGDRIQVLVARDLDFRTVYELRSASDR